MRRICLTTWEVALSSYTHHIISYHIIIHTQYPIIIQIYICSSRDIDTVKFHQPSLSLEIWLSKIWNSEEVIRYYLKQLSCPGPGWWQLVSALLFIIFHVAALSRSSSWWSSWRSICGDLAARGAKHCRSSSQQESVIINRFRFKILDKSQV